MNDQEQAWAILARASGYIMEQKLIKRDGKLFVAPNIRDLSNAQAILRDCQNQLSVTGDFVLAFCRSLQSSLSVAQVASELNVSHSYVGSLIRSGLLAAERYANGPYQVSAAEVARYQKARKGRGRPRKEKA